MKAAKTIFELTYKKSPQLLKTVGLKKWIQWPLLRPRAGGELVDGGIVERSRGRSQRIGGREINF